MKLLRVCLDHERDHRQQEFVLQPEFGAGQDALGLLVRHPDQRLLVDGHQLVADLQPPVLRQRRGKP